MQNTQLPPAIFLMGPTAAGKTRLALALHAALPLEIISVDAAQVYRGLDIGTAKPTREERARAPHRLIDICDASESYSAANFCVDALAAMQEATAAGRIPLLVGGTMFYFRALEYGLPELPAADPKVRAGLLEEAAERGWTAMHKKLAERDPARAARVHPNDPQRILRALEIIALTGHPASTYGTLGGNRLPYEVIKIALCPQDRAWLHARIAERFRNMLDEGFMDEAQALFARQDLSPEHPAMRTVGYRQAGLYLSGKINYDGFCEQAMAATRQLAKRQYTWMRADADLQRLDSSAQNLDVEAATRKLLLTRLGI
jgi:tRNA dimethylallyltransferase